MNPLPYIPIPRLSLNYYRKGKWICSSEEYCTWDGYNGFYCSGHGDTVQEAYEDWLESYASDRYLGDEE